MKEFSAVTRRMLAVFAVVMVWLIVGAIVLWILQAFGVVKVGIRFAMVDIAALAIAIWAALQFTKGDSKP